MKNWSKMYLINPSDLNHLLGELKNNGFNAYDTNPESDSPLDKYQIEQPDNIGIGGFLFNRDRLWITGHSLHVWGEKLDEFMQNYHPPSASDSRPSASPSKQ